jgi:hypothetical protein
MMKNRQHQHKSKPCKQENFSILQLLWKMLLQIQYTLVKLRPHVNAPKKPSDSHAHEAAECHQE